MTDERRDGIAAAIFGKCAIRRFDPDPETFVIGAGDEDIRVAERVSSDQVRESGVTDLKSTVLTSDVWPVSTCFFTS